MVSNNSPMKDMGRTHRRMETNPLHMANKLQAPMVSKLLTDSKGLGPTASSHLRPMVNKAPMGVRVKGQTLMGSKGRTEARAAAAVEVMEARDKEQVEAAAVATADGVMVKVVARAAGLETGQKEAGSEAEVVAVTTAAVAMIAVGVMTAAAVAMTVVDTTVVEEEDLLVWEVVTVVATKISVGLETTAPGMNQQANKITLTTTRYLYKDWGRTPRFRK